MEGNVVGKSKKRSNLIKSPREASYYKYQKKRELLKEMREVLKISREEESATKPKSEKINNKFERFKKGG